MSSTDLSGYGDPQADEPVNRASGFKGYLLDEDWGLKKALTGMTVTDINMRPRSVQTWFEHPQREERRITYPYVTIAFVGESIAHEREHRGRVPIGYQYLQDVPWDPAVAPVSEWPIPMYLDYEVTTHASLNDHHSQLIAMANQDGPLHPRFGRLICPGGTVRRVERLSASNAPGSIAAAAGGHLRLFRMIYRIRVASEIEYQAAVHSRVQRVVLNFMQL